MFHILVCLYNFHFVCFWSPIYLIYVVYQSPIKINGLEKEECLRALPCNTDSAAARNCVIVSKSLPTLSFCPVVICKITGTGETFSNISSCITLLFAENLNYILLSVTHWNYFLNLSSAFIRNKKNCSISPPIKIWVTRIRKDKSHIMVNNTGESSLKVNQFQKEN